MCDFVLKLMLLNHFLLLLKLVTFVNIPSKLPVNLFALWTNWTPSTSLPINFKCPTTISSATVDTHLTTPEKLSTTAYCLTSQPHPLCFSIIQHVPPSHPATKIFTGAKKSSQSPHRQTYINPNPTKPDSSGHSSSPPQISFKTTFCSPHTLSSPVSPIRFKKFSPHY